MANQGGHSSEPIEWADDGQWRECFQTLEWLFTRHPDRLNRVRQLARGVRTDLEALYPWWDRSTSRLCPACAEACCGRTRITFQFRDLVFIQALGLRPPPHQVRRNHDEPCRYLGPKGCRLERLIRPFLCTFWLCPAMTRMLREQPSETRRLVRGRLITAHQGLQTMEQVFVRQVSIPA